jgi:DNA polymerase elongation subunit (family B)
MKTVALDIETAPAICFSFTLWKANIGLEQIIEHPRIIAFSYQWEGSKKVGFFSEYHNSRKEMLDAFHAILDEADVVLHFNGKRFDTPWIRGELAIEGYEPPSPFAEIDLYQIIKGKFRFISGKLDYASMRLLNDRKESHSGFSLWRDCLIGDEVAKRKAWAVMKKYAIKDTALLFPLLEKVRPWATTGMPNRALYEGVADGCPTCASDDRQKRGFAYTGISKFQQYRCNSCGTWYRGSQRLDTTLGRR